MWLTTASDEAPFPSPESGVRLWGLCGGFDRTSPIGTKFPEPLSPQIPYIKGETPNPRIVLLTRGSGVRLSRPLPKGEHHRLPFLSRSDPGSVGQGFRFSSGLQSVAGSGGQPPELGVAGSNPARVANSAFMFSELENRPPADFRIFVFKPALAVRKSWRGALLVGRRAVDILEQLRVNYAC